MEAVAALQLLPCSALLTYVIITFKLILPRSFKMNKLSRFLMVFTALLAICIVMPGC